MDAVQGVEQVLGSTDETVTEPEDAASIFGFLKSQWNKLQTLFSEITIQFATVTTKLISIDTEMDSLAKEVTLTNMQRQITELTTVVEDLKRQLSTSNSQLMLDLYNSFVASGATSLEAWQSTDDLKVALAGSSVMANSNYSHLALEYIVANNLSLNSYLSNLKGYTGSTTLSAKELFQNWDNLTLFCKTAYGYQALSSQSAVNLVATAGFTTATDANIYGAKTYSNVIVTKLTTYYGLCRAVSTNGGVSTSYNNPTVTFAVKNDSSVKYTGTGNVNSRATTFTVNRNVTGTTMTPMDSINYTYPDDPRLCYDVTYIKLP